MKTSGCVSMYVDWGIVAGFECLRLCQLWQQPAGERPRPTRCFSRSGQKEGSETSQKPYPRKRRGRGRKVHFPICIDYNDCNAVSSGTRGASRASGARGASGRKQLANLGPRVGQAGQVAETKRGKRQKSVSGPAGHPHCNIINIHQYSTEYRILTKLLFIFRIMEGMIEGIDKITGWRSPI